MRHHEIDFFNQKLLQGPEFGASIGLGRRFKRYLFFSKKFPNPFTSTKRILPCRNSTKRYRGFSSFKTRVLCALGPKRTGLGEEERSDESSRTKLSGRRILGDDFIDCLHDFVYFLHGGELLLRQPFCCSEENFLDSTLLRRVASER
jgi:hypothetical protein